MRQLWMAFSDSQDRETALEGFLRGLGLKRREQLVLKLLAAHGQRFDVGNAAATRLSITKVMAGRTMGCAPNTFVRGAEDLELRGLVSIVRTTTPWTYVVNWKRIARLAPEPQEDLAQLSLFRSDDPSSGPPPVHPRSRPHTHKQETYKSHSYSSHTHNHKRPLQLRIDNQQLRRAVEGRRRPYLAKHYHECVRQGYLQDTREDRTKFLALCHHAATREQIANPGGVIYRAVLEYNLERAGQESFDWAREVLREADREKRDVSDQPTGGGQSVGTEPRDRGSHV